MLRGDADADIKILSAKFLLICNVGSPTRSSLFFTKTAPASESTKSKSTAEDAEASLQCTGQHRHKFPSLSENLKIFVIKLSRHSNPQRQTPKKRNRSGHHFAPLPSSTCRTLDHIWGRLPCTLPYCSPDGKTISTIPSYSLAGNSGQHGKVILLQELLIDAIPSVGLTQLLFLPFAVWPSQPSLADLLQSHSPDSDTAAFISGV